MKVCMFGSAYAMLLNDLAESAGDQEGFLVGSRAQSVKRENSDTASRTDKQTTLVHISASIPLRGQKVYTASGQAWKEEESEALRKSNHPDKQIVGFYQLKKQDVIKPSIKDHRLMKAAEGAFGENFIYLIVCESVAENRATYKYSSIAYLSYLAKGRQPIPVHIEIPNLGKGEKVEYTAASGAVAQSSEPSRISKVCNWPERVNSMAAIVTGFDHIHEAVVEETERLKEELMEEEKERKQMEKEVQELMEQLEAGREVSREEILAGDLASALESILPPPKMEEAASGENDADNTDDEMPLVNLIRVPAQKMEVDR